MGDQSSVIRPSVFLDTNVLHFLRMYLDLASTFSFAPCGPINLWSDIQELLRKGGLLRHQREYAKDGFVVYAFLQQAVQDDCQILFSQISLAEIVHGLVEGKAHINMAKAGVPYRMRQRSSDLSALVRAWMSAEDYQEVREGYEFLVPRLENLLGVDLWPTSRDHAVPDVLKMVETILGGVYFDVVDAWLYAEALIAQVQKILTADKYFADTVNMIYDPSGNVQNEEDRVMWQAVQSSLRAATAAVLLVQPAQETVVTLPKALCPRDLGSLKDCAL